MKSDESYPHGGAWKVQVSEIQGCETGSLLTEVVTRIARAFPSRPIGAFWAVCKEVVLISDILEEVDLVLALEESGSNAMHYSISPALKR